MRRSSTIDIKFFRAFRMHHLLLRWPSLLLQLYNPTLQSHALHFLVSPSSSQLPPLNVHVLLQHGYNNCVFPSLIYAPFKFDTVTTCTLASIHPLYTHATQIPFMLVIHTTCCGLRMFRFWGYSHDSLVTTVALLTVNSRTK